LTAAVSDRRWRRRRRAWPRRLRWREQQRRQRCFASSPQSGAGTAAAGQDGTPKRGGTLRLGITGGSDTDTLDGQNMLNNPDFARCFALFEGLTGLDPQGKVYNRLAESIEPNKEGSTWTSKVRPNVVCHDGKKFGAKDVLYSLKRIKQKKYPGAIIPYLFPNVDAVSAKVKGIKSSVTDVALNSFDWPNIWMES
jgi:ABC-type transport system substrate-binding protein